MPNFVAPMIGRGVVLQTPAADGTSGQAITTNASGVLSFSSVGNVTKVGTPANNQIGVWTGDGTIEGDADLTWSESTFKATAGVCEWNFNQGAADVTPAITVKSTSGKAAALLCGSSGAAFVWDSTGTMTFAAESRSNIDNESISAGSPRLVFNGTYIANGSFTPLGRLHFRVSTSTDHGLVLQTDSDATTRRLLQVLSSSSSELMSITPLGKINAAASTTASASLNIPSGTAPTSPNNGDIWSDGSDILVRLGGTTYTLNKT